jgi:hypothetical protein
MVRKSSRRPPTPRRPKIVVVPRPATYEELREAMADIDALTERFTKITDLQFQRIAQMQAELDEVRAAWTKARRRKGL